MDTKPEGKPVMSAEMGMDVGVETLKHRVSTVVMVILTKQQG